MYLTMLYPLSARWKYFPNKLVTSNPFKLLTAMLVLAALTSVNNLYAHTPYAQWDAFRVRHLQVLTSRSDLNGDAVADQWVAVLAEHLPKSKAVVSRARDFTRVASLLKTDQAKIAVLSYKQAKSMINGYEPFEEFAPLPLQLLLDNGTYLLVAREDLPTLLEQATALNLSVPSEGVFGMSIHPGAQAAKLALGQ